MAETSFKQGYRNKVCLVIALTDRNKVWSNLSEANQLINSPEKTNSGLGKNNSIFFPENQISESTEDFGKFQERKKSMIFFVSVKREFFSSDQTRWKFRRREKRVFRNVEIFLLSEGILKSINQ